MDNNQGVTIQPGAALDDAQDIVNIVNAVADSVDALHRELDAHLIKEQELEFADRLFDQWQSIKDNDINGAALTDLKNTAAFLEKAIKDNVAYSQREI